MATPTDDRRVTIAETPADYRLARELMDEYFTWALEATGYRDLVAIAPGIARELDHLADHYRSDSAHVLLGWTPNQEPAGVCAVERIDSTSAELKRLYVRPRARRSGLASRLTATVADLARAMGCDTLRVDIHEGIMQSAIVLYRHIGFVESTRCTDLDVPELRGFALDLTR
jgi:GNAT superfamily N-acetyltransferase